MVLSKDLRRLRRRCVNVNLHKLRPNAPVNPLICAPAEARRGILFDFSQGNLENLVGNLEEIFRGFFLTHRTKAQKFQGKFWSIFRKKIRGSKKIFRAKFTLQTCHLSKSIRCVKRRTKSVKFGPLSAGFDHFFIFLSAGLAASVRVWDLKCRFSTRE